MKARHALKVVIALLLAMFGYGLAASGYAAHSPVVSGEIIEGYRILPVPKTSERVHFTVFRGDYIKFKMDAHIDDPQLRIPELSIQAKLPGDLSQAPYFKMKKAGTYPFTLGAVSGDITVIDYQQPNYKEVTASQAQKLIRNVRPLVLDVRTAAEFKQGHIPDAMLIPVQELQRRWKEIAAYQNQDILIYCATGNRSTVASKILIDNGFKRIYNLRHGIADWRRNNQAVVR